MSAALTIEITVQPRWFSKYTSAERISVVSIAFVICLPITVAKKKVYRPAMIGLTVARTAPTTILRAPVNSISTNRTSSTVGA